MKFTFTDREGSVIVDAAVCIPVFVIAVALMLLISIQAGAEETATAGLVNSALSAVDAAAALDSADDFFVSGNISFRTAWQIYLAGEDAENAEAAGFPRFYTGLDLPLGDTVNVDNVVLARVSASETLSNPLGFSDTLKGTRSVCFRPFCGESESPDAEDSGKRVYVFPKRGARYHVEGCSVLKNGCCETVLSKALKKECRPCKICHPEKLAPGSTVYKFLDSSGVYHRKECSSITKKYISMPESQAVSQGYTPCMLCIGAEK